MDERRLPIVPSPGSAFNNPVGYETDNESNGNSSELTDDSTPPPSDEYVPAPQRLSYDALGNPEMRPTVQWLEWETIRVADSEPDSDASSDAIRAYIPRLLHRRVDYIRFAEQPYPPNP